MRATPRADPTARTRVIVFRGLVHLCAAYALGFAARTLRAGSGWESIPVCDDADGLPMLSIVVPARNEADNIERCVRTLLAQRLHNFEVIVVDDRSTDATDSILQRLAADDARLQIVRGAELPDGWVGKPWALHQSDQQRALGAWLRFFTDADLRSHAPDAQLHRGVARYALGHKVDAVTLATGQEFGTFWERAVLYHRHC